MVKSQIKKKMKETSSKVKATQPVGTNKTTTPREKKRKKGKPPPGRQEINSRPISRLILSPFIHTNSVTKERKKSKTFQKSVEQSRVKETLYYERPMHKNNK